MILCNGKCNAHEAEILRYTFLFAVIRAEFYVNTGYIFSLAFSCHCLLNLNLRLDFIRKGKVILILLFESLLNDVLIHKSS